MKDLISREEALMALTGFNLPTDKYKLIALYDKRIKALQTVEAIPMSVIEKIHDAIDNADSDGFLANEHDYVIDSTLTKEHIHEIIDKAVKECTHDKG